MHEIIGLMMDYDPECETIRGTQLVGEPNEIFD